MSMQTLVGAAVLAWVAGIVASLIAWRWSWRSAPGRFWPAVVLALTSMLIAYAGMTRLKLEYSRTDNGVVQRHVDSRWFFIASLVLSALVLIYVLWKGRKGSRLGEVEKGAA